MNIFFVDRDPVIAGRSLCDVHTVKMIVESAQLLSTARLSVGQEAPYKATHIKHPCAIWARSRTQNYKWLVEHLRALCAEYTQRYGKTHATEKHLAALAAPIALPEGWTEPAQAMPDEYKHEDPVEAYRAYYRFKAVTLPRFTYKETGTGVPVWIR
jgi:hypothetical protein